jgi:diguanylate cyclase
LEALNEYDLLSKEVLIEKVRELENLIYELKEEKNQEELLNFPWTGNLGHWYWNVKSNNLICNDQKVLALKYTKDEMPEKLGFEFFTEKLHLEDYERVMENMRQHLFGHTSAYEVEYRIQAKDGTWKWYYDRGKVTKRDEYGRPALVAGIVFDITVKKEMELLIEEQNKKLTEMVNLDYLTKIFNRKGLNEKLESEIARINRYNGCLSVLMMDIDHFKAINDKHGHLAGDLVLKKVSETIKENAREGDIVGRYGGEEFMIILPECTSEQGFAVAERIRKSIQESVFTDGIKVTISGGIKEYKGEAIDKLIDGADKLLYRAKNNGRNQIVCKIETHNVNV